MTWRDWPKGQEATDVLRPRNNFCPVCNTPLRPIEVWNITPERYYYDERSIYYTAICTKCRTQYSRSAPIGTVTISPDAETITELEERVRTLEETLSRLISWIRTQQQPQQLRTTQKQETPQDDAEDFTRKYHYLL